MINFQLEALALRKEVRLVLSSYVTTECQTDFFKNGDATLLTPLSYFSSYSSYSSYIKSCLLQKCLAWIYRECLGTIVTYDKS